MLPKMRIFDDLYPGTKEVNAKKMRFLVYPEVSSDRRRCKTIDAPPALTMLNSTTRPTECIIRISKSSYTTYRYHDYGSHSTHANLSSRALPRYEVQS